MGKSGTTSCFKFVGCGDPDSVDRDDLPAEEIKDSNDKGKWSFRKRSPAHRVLSNSVISETSLGNKSSLDTAIVGLQKQATCTNTDSKLAEKISPAVEKNAADIILNEFSAMEKNAEDVTPDEKNAVEVNLGESSAVEKGVTAVTPDESSVIIIQTAVRGFLAQKDVMKNNAVIMLQAAIRGYVVRKVAVGSLRCVQAIVKMQLLIRKRLPEGSRFDEKDGKLDKQASKGKEKLGSKVVTYTPIEELLRNRFACQILKSDIRSKTINIKCEPLKSDSAWKWMERWMSIYSNGSNNNSPGLEYTAENLDEKWLEKSRDEESVILSEGDEKNGIRYGMPNLESNNDIGRPFSVMTKCSEDSYDGMYDSFPDQATESGFTSSFANESEMEYKQQTESKFDDISDSLPNQATKSSFASNKEPVSSTYLLEREYKEHIESSCGASIEEPFSLKNESNSSDTSGKKAVLLGYRRSSSFIAAQSKFEVLSLGGNNSTKPVDLLKTLPPLKASSVTNSTKPVDLLKTLPPLKASSLTPASEVDIVIGSESGTELSVSSTLDSPHGELIDGGAFDAVNTKTSVLDDQDDADDYQKNNHMMNATVYAEVDSQIMEGISFQEDKDENIASDGSNENGSAMAVEQAESDGSRGIKVHMETESSHPLSPKNVQTESSDPLIISPLSPQASPRSHVTGQDFQDTPCSHVSVKSKESSRKSVPDHRKQKSGSSSGNGQKSDSNHYLEQLSMDKKTGMRRNSFGSASTDHGHQEQRESSSSSSNSIPSYMQATQSARAKAIANNSPRSIPDTLGKDFHIKKRHSLPGVNTKHVPQAQVQQSTSQTLQDAKAIGVHSPQERKWRR